MGNTNKPPLPNYIYNKYVDPNKPFGENFSGPFVHPSVNDFEKEIEEKYKNRTLIENNIQKMLKFKDRDCLGIRKKIGENEYENKYTYFTYQQVHDMCVNFSKNLHEIQDELVFKDEYKGIKFKLIGIFAKNCTEWVVTDMGCQMDSITTCTLYATLGQEAFKYICDQTKITTICVSPDLVDLCCKYKKLYNLDSLKYAILFDYTTNCNSKENLDKLTEAGFKAYSFKDDFLKENSKVKYEDLEISKPDTVMTICYTSGTTGNPKGVMLNQRNLISVLETVIKDSSVPLDENGAHISFLPLAHIFERMVISGFMSVAAKIGFISGSIRTTLMDDMTYFGPTLLFTVPRVLQTIRQKVFDKFDHLSYFKRQLAYMAYNTKKENYRKYGVLTHSIYDALIFSNIRQMFGNKILCVLCASAPMPKDLADDFKIFLSIPVIEGLGMTELSGSAFCTNYHDLTNNTAGGVTSGAIMKIADVKDLNYTHKDVIDGVPCPAGEICLKGPLIFVGYYKNDEETNKSFDEDGFFHTGDVGRIYTNLGNGLKIVDRVKEIFKLSQGEYIIPAKLESAYHKSKFVNQLMIYGNSSKNNIIGIVNPNVKSCAEALEVEEDEIKKMENDKKLKDLIIKDLDEIAKEVNFNSLEKVKYIIIDFEGFTIENECLTPTLKVVRKKVEAYFKEKIDALYKTIPIKK